MYTIGFASAIATTVSYCDRTPILLDPALLKFLRLRVPCKVQLISKELELDAYEVPVPKNWYFVELMVLDNKRATIEQIVTSTPEYQGYEVVDPQELSGLYTKEEMGQADSETGNVIPRKRVEPPVFCSKVWKQWKSVQDALAWGQSELPKMTQEELQQEFLALPAMDGKKAPAWVARVNELMRGTVLANQR